MKTKKMCMYRMKRLCTNCNHHEDLKDLCLDESLEKERIKDWWNSNWFRSEPEEMVKRWDAIHFEYMEKKEQYFK